MQEDSPATPSTLDVPTVRLVHDLRNSLASLRAAANILSRPGRDEALIATVADGIRAEVEQMLASLEQFVGRNADGSKPQPRAATAAAATELSVLIADDNMDSANALATYLRMQGHRVTVAFDGEQALRLATDQPPHVMLLDISMPTLDGYELARQIRLHPWGTNIRLVSISGWLSPEDRARAAAVGYEAHLSKPIDMDQLDALLQE
jgi:CheY-like chemotaxis protein